MVAKAQTQLLVNPLTRDRADALALALGEPRAEILRRALEGGGLRELEAQYAAQLGILDSVAIDMIGIEGTYDLVRRMVKDGLRLADVTGRKRYPTKRA